MPDPRSVRTRLRPLPAAVLFGALALTAMAASPAEHQHGSSSSKAPAAKKAPPAAPGSCSACVERGAVIDPIRFANWNDTDVRKAYEVARRYPETLDLIHCFCECKESPREHHKSLLTCFTTEHGAGCGICQHEAILAGKLKDQGASDDQVETTVESLHKTDRHPPTKGRGI